MKGGGSLTGEIMKKYFIVIIVIIVIASLIIIPYSNAHAEGERLLTFPQSNFAFKKPASWEVVKTSRDECILCLAKKPKDESFPLVITIKAAKSMTNDLDEYARRLIPENKKAFLNNLIQINNIKESVNLLGIYPAKEILYIGEGAIDVKTETMTTDEAVQLNISTINTPVLYKNIFTVQNGIIYILTYGGEEETFKNYEKDFKYIVNNFIINKNIKKHTEAQYKALQNRLKKYNISFPK